MIPPSDEQPSIMPALLDILAVWAVGWAFVTLMTEVMRNR